MVYTAFDSITIVPNLPLKVECFTSYGPDKLLIGTADGLLLTYQISKNSGEPKYVSKVLSTRKGFSKKPIQQLCAIPDLDLLLSLSDGYIYLHSLSVLNPLGTIKNVKSCNLFLAKKFHGEYTLCVAAKKRLYIFKYEDNQFKQHKEHFIPDSVRSLAWCENSICVGFKKEYTLIDTETGALSELFPTGRTQVPLCLTLPASSEILVAKDNVGITVDFNGKPTRKFGLSWSDMAVTIGFLHPYVIAPVGQQFVEVRILTSKVNQDSLVQNIPISGSRLLSQPNYTDFDDPTNDTQFGKIYLANEKSIYLLVLQPFDTQVFQLVRKNEFEEALHLCEQVKGTPNELQKWKVSSIHLDYAFWLFLKGEYSKAMEHFGETEIDPRLVISLYPDLLPRSSKFNPDLPIPEEARTILKEVGERKALQALIPFLTSRRVPASAELPQEQALAAEAVDTALLKAYLSINEDLVATFLRIPNRCEIADSERVLLNAKKYAELVTFYKSKGLHRKALDLLQRLGQSENMSDALTGVEPTIEYLQDLGADNEALIIEYSQWVLEKDMKNGLKIFTHDESPIKPRVVIQHLERIEGKNSVDMRVAYIENAIHEKGIIDKDLHNDLILLYLKAYSIAKADNDSEKQNEIRRKLLQMLKSSTYYNPEKMLSKFTLDEYEELYEEIALLLSRIARHDQALSIYVHKMNRPDLAEKYCIEHHGTETPESKDIFVSLLQMYLHTKENTSYENIKEAVALLEKHFDKIDTAKALKLLPTNTPVSMLGDYFQAILTRNTVLRRDLQIKKNLVKSENQQVREQYITERARKIKISTERICCVCKKRIGNSAFACYPNGVVVHFICCTNKNVCPQTGKDFRELNSSLTL